MARIRTIKPEIAFHGDLYDLEIETGLPMRFAWCMLFTACDREGRFKWRPRDLKLQVLPHDAVDFSRVLDAWLTRGFVVKYRVGNEWFGSIPTWRKHQAINNRESASELPGVNEAEEVEDSRNQSVANACTTREARDNNASATGDARDDHAGSGEGKGKERKGREGVGEERPTEPDFESVPNLDLESWRIWLAYRRKAGHKRYVDARMAARLAQYPKDVQAAAIDESITQQYQGLFPEKVKPNGAHQQNGSETAYERSGRRLREWATANGVDAACLG